MVTSVESILASFGAGIGVGRCRVRESCGRTWQQNEPHAIIELARYALELEHKDHYVVLAEIT